MGSALKNFAKFTGKHLCQSLFFNKVAGHLANSFLIAHLLTLEQYHLDLEEFSGKGLQIVLMNCYRTIFPYLLKPRTIQTHEISRKHRKPAKTTPKNCETIQNDPKSQNCGNLEFFNCFRFSNFELKCPKSKSINFLILTKFRMYLILSPYQKVSCKKEICITCILYVDWEVSTF